MTLDDYANNTLLIKSESKRLGFDFCGISKADFLDEEATAAFRRIKQFPNPPRGLVVNGKITFTFGFLVYNNNNNFILKF